MNWYKKAQLLYELGKLEIEASISKEVSTKSSILILLISLLTGTMTFNEAKAFLKEKQINETKLMNMVGKDSIEQVTNEDLYKIKENLEDIQSVNTIVNTNPDFDELFSIIAYHEGFQNKVYKDRKGNKTIGIGFNLDRPGADNTIKSLLGINYNDLLRGRKLNDKQILILFRYDLEQAIHTAKGFINNFDNLPKQVKIVIIDMAYNLGSGGLAEFKKMKIALERNDYRNMAKEMKNSSWFAQVGKRGPNLLNLINELI
jgi:lysozyme